MGTVDEMCCKNSYCEASLVIDKGNMPIIPEITKKTNYQDSNSKKVTINSEFNFIPSNFAVKNIPKLKLSSVR